MKVTEIGGDPAVAVSPKIGGIYTDNNGFIFLQISKEQAWILRNPKGSAGDNCITEVSTKYDKYYEYKGKLVISNH